MTDFAEAVARIQAAHDLADLDDAYRRLAKLVHPDVAPPGEERTAAAAFAKLAALRSARTAAAIGPYRLTDRHATGDIADLYHVDGFDAVLKVPRRPLDNDLMAAEASALRTLHTTADPGYRAYAPRLLDSFTYEDAGRARRTVNVVERLHGFLPLSAIRRTVDPRDAAWMWRRLLVALGWAHRAGLVHGAVLPEHVLIHPAEHGVVLVDWCYAVAPGERIAALVARHRDAYPPEVADRRPAGPATDIFMATVLIRRLMHDPPAALIRFADGCTYDAPRMRPQDAWRLLAELDELLESR